MGRRRARTSSFVAARRDDKETKLAREVGCRWVDRPAAHGPRKTICNRFAHWSARGIWRKIFAAVAAPSKPPKQAALDSSHGKARRRASGGPFDKLGPSASSGGGQISGDLPLVLVTWLVRLVLWYRQRWRTRERLILGQQSP